MQRLVICRHVNNDTIAASDDATLASSYFKIAVEAIGKVRTRTLMAISLKPKFTHLAGTENQIRNECGVCAEHATIHAQEGGARD